MWTTEIYPRGVDNGWMRAEMFHVKHPISTSTGALPNVSRETSEGFENLPCFT